MREGQLLKEKRSDERLEGKPAKIVSHISANSYPPGSYRLELRLDNEPIGAAQFRIHASPVLGSASTFNIGPDCGGAPRANLKALRPGRPEFPPNAIEKHVKGCAVAAIVLGADGTPTDVRVLADQPKNYGFGDAVAMEAWQSVFPSGHAGETTFLTIHFNLAPPGR